MCIAATCLAMLLVGSSASLAEEWHQMTYSDAQDLGSTSPLARVVWKDEIAAQNAYVRQVLKQPLPADKNAMLDIISKDFAVNGETLIVSIASTRSCRAGANNAASEIEPSICEIKIARIKDGKFAGIQKTTGCYIDHHDPDLPAKDRNDATLVSFDPQTGVLRFQTTVGGRMIANCNRVVTVK